VLAYVCLRWGEMGNAVRMIGASDARPNLSPTAFCMAA
jgi:hypothetical protein